LTATVPRATAGVALVLMFVDVTMVI
jgi:hypothetical protein